MTSSKASMDDFSRLRSEYLDGMDEKLTFIDSKLVEWEKSRKPEDAIELKRQIHSIKGSGGMYGFPTLTSICHQFEDYIEVNFEQKSLLVFDPMFQFADLMTDYINHHKGTGAAEDSETGHKFAVKLKSIRPANVIAILVSDDSRTTHKLISSLTKDLPVQLSFTNDGLVALNRLLHEQFDAFISGGTVANLGGIPVIAAYKLERPERTTKTILLSSSSPNSLDPRLMPDRTINRGPKMVEEILAELTKLTNTSNAAA